MTQCLQTIDAHELKKRMENDPKLCLIDVRELNEWDEKHIPKAIHIPKDNLTAVIDSVVPDKHQPVYLHCKGGTRSYWAGERLVELGYTNVYSINGGISQWFESGYPVE